MSARRSARVVKLICNVTRHGAFCCLSYISGGNIIPALPVENLDTVASFLGILCEIKEVPSVPRRVEPALVPPRESAAMSSIKGVTGAPNEQALVDLISRTSYSLVQENGQRKYGGPPPGWEGPPPSRGTEIFVGKIPRDIYEDELVPVFQKIGRIYEFRLMMDFSGSNRGFAFCTYCQKEDAKRAVKELNNYEIRHGRFLGVCSSVDNCRLFVGGIPKTKVKEEIQAEMSKVTEGVVDVIVYPSANDKSKNRGFAFVEYTNHRAAAMARRKLIPGRVQLWGHTIAVDWAEPEPETDEDIMASVRILYVRNLMLTTTEEHLREVFEKAVAKKECIERVKKLKDYAFVHFKEREDALKAMETINDGFIEGSKVEVVLAKPVDKTEYNLKTAKAKGLPQVIGFDVQNSIMSPVFAPVAADGQTGRGVARTVTPSRGRGRGAAGSRGAGGSRSYLPPLVRGGYKRHPSEARLYDLLPGAELTPTNPITLKPQTLRLPTQVLEEVCQKQHWGLPVYQLHSAVQRDVSTNTDTQFFLFKVSIPALFTSPIQPNKLCRTVEEAKIYAAEYTLQHLGIPIESSEITVPQMPNSAAIYQGRALAPAIPIAREVSVPLSSAAPSYVLGKVVPGADFYYQPYH